MENLESVQPLSPNPSQEQQQDSKMLLDNILMASASLSPLLFNGTFNYESILNNQMLTPPLTPLSMLQQTVAAQFVAALSNASTPNESNLSIDIPPSPEGFRLPWPLKTMTTAVENAQVTSSSDSSSGQSTPRSAKSPNHIKRPMNGFMIWAKEERRMIVEEAKSKDPNSMMHNSNISRILGARWNALSQEEKRPFMEEQARQKKLHMEKHPDYQFKPRRRRIRMVDGKQISLKEYSEAMKLRKDAITDLETGYSKDQIDLMTNSTFLKIFAPLVSL